jgi:DNA-binding beta-propeller fold protein YncE
MLRRFIFIAALAAAGFGVAAAAAVMQAVLPSGWRLTPPAGPLATVGTMPQGIALSPDGKTLAVVESGDTPPALRLLEAKTLQTNSVIPLKGAFGKPVWLDNTHVLVAGANTDALLTVDVKNQQIAYLSTDKNAWPATVALDSNGPLAVVANDGNGTIVTSTLVALSGDTVMTPSLKGGVAVGSHPSDLVFSRNGQDVFVAVRGDNTVQVYSVALGESKPHKTIHVGLHPSALALSADGSQLFVAESDDDAIGIIDTRTGIRVAGIPVGFKSARVHGYGANPNALLVHGNDLFVSLGGENAIAIIRNGRVAAYIPAGWYPTGLAMGTDGTLYVSNGKGERAPPNPQFEPGKKERGGYVAAITTGSVRAIPRALYEKGALVTAQALSNAMPLWTAAPAARTIIRPHGPILHVIYVIKENRSYDQVLGDIGGANGDPALVMFGRTITPNQHAIARRFGVFDNAFADAQVSADGHNWTDAATANDYVERFWPANYAGRRSLYDFQDGGAPDVPHSGYLWDEANRAHITYRDYGEEDVHFGSGPSTILTFPGLKGHYDPAFVGWNLKYSDTDRFIEWKREFDAFVSHRNLPQLEIVYFPNDHMAGTQSGMPTPEAYMAMNDWVVGQLVDAVSHSPYWKSTVIFVLEDDAQNGPDHVSDQRSTFYVASPYARGGVNHTHYSTVSVLRTIELLLGLPPMSVRDTTTRPFYDAFASPTINATPFVAIKPGIDMNAVNTRAAYGSAISARLNFSRPDAVDPKVLNDILEHAVRHR